jgi:hypothetical protein
MLTRLFIQLVLVSVEEEERRKRRMERFGLVSSSCRVLFYKMDTSNNS